MAIREHHVRVLCPCVLAENTSMAANPTDVRRPLAKKPVPARPRVAAQPRRPKPPVTGFRKLYKEWGATAGMLLAALAIVIGILGKDSRRMFADEGLGYGLGIVGTLLILTLLLYPLRKRFKFLKILGPARDWFRTHMILGVVGPLAILYHSNFTFGSINSSAALLAMLCVAGSGLVGRFLYAKVHHGLYGRKANLKELLASVKLSLNQSGAAAQFVPNLMKEIAAYDRQVLQPPKGIIDSMFLPMKLAVRTRTGYRRIIALVVLQLEAQAAHSPAVAQHRHGLEKACRAFVREHLRRVRRVASFAAYERLFSLWHKVHLPFFYIMLITVVVHVVAVHVYSI